jgi:prepilin-type N-terminal cleavage/methylation domain-containing protein
MTLLFKSRHGFTLLEILLTIAIITGIAVGVLGVLSTYKQTRGLDAGIETVYAAFSKAYFDTVSSRNDSQYGVHLATSSAVVFPGAVYNEGETSNLVYPLPQGVEIANVILAGGGFDVVFARLSGTTNHTGTFEVRSSQNTTVLRTIHVWGTGTISQ